MASEKTPLVPSGIAPSPSDASGDKHTVYFLERNNSNASHHRRVNSNVVDLDAEEIETIPEGSTAGDFDPRPVSVTGGGGSVTSGPKPPRGGWLQFFRNVGKKSQAFASSSDGDGGGGGTTVPRFAPAPVKIDPKVFFANERTFLAWMHVSVILAGASVAIVAFADSPSEENDGGGRAHSSRNHHNLADQLYGIVLLPVSIAFILYAMTQYSRRASMIRRKAPGPYVDIVGPTVLTVILMLSIVTQFSIKLYTLM